MTMTETPTEAPKPKPKARRKPARTKPTQPAAPKPAAEFAGITVTDCPAACNVDRCVISGIGVCMHPHKGGLHARQQTQPDTMRRFNEAKRILGKRKLDIAG